MTETTVQNDIVLALGGSAAVRLFRFIIGTFRRLYDEGKVTVGVPGMADTLGWKSTIITPEMVGRRVAVFVAIEIKQPGARTQKKRLALQQSFVNTVRQHGGLAGFATSVREAQDILNQPIGVLE